MHTSSHEVNLINIVHTVEYTATLQHEGKHRLQWEPRIWISVFCLTVAKQKQSTGTNRSRALPPIQETFSIIYGLSPLPCKEEQKIHVFEQQTDVSMQKKKKTRPGKYVVSVELIKAKQRNPSSTVRWHWRKMTKSWLRTCKQSCWLAPTKYLYTENLKK